MGRIQRNQTGRRHLRGGFTLMEICIVFMLIAVIAAIAIPAVHNSRKEAENAAFAESVKNIAQSIRANYIESGQYPSDLGPGKCPAEYAVMLGSMDWSQETTIGGQWDWDYQQFGYEAGISVYKPTRTVVEMAEIDRLLDDGDLTSGSFRSRPDGYIYVVQFK